MSLKVKQGVVYFKKFFKKYNKNLVKNQFNRKKNSPTRRSLSKKKGSSSILVSYKTAFIALVN
ncbi:hypothetical protein DVG78_24585 [Runella aurantiaca]|uniref:Uncharacterized protein n=1 Tax=Runella aurantiaca TaxID=2282308 RepID=A0A369I400_9BACT|nr:hypothetical protein DVG78_24585 [Runella aurantiaca]